MLYQIGNANTIMYMALPFFAVFRHFLLVHLLINSITKVVSFYKIVFKTLK